MVNSIRAAWRRTNDTTPRGEYMRYTQTKNGTTYNGKRGASVSYRLHAHFVSDFSKFA
jgi:hypothetical protein